MFVSAVAASGTKIPFGDAALAAVTGYAVVFIGLILLMCVVQIFGKVMVSKGKKAEAAAPAPAVSAPAPAASKGVAPGSAGDIKLYNVSDKDAAMVMAIVAEKTGKPLNELRFKSIREVK